MHLRRALLVVVLSAIVLGAPARALAAQTYSDTIVGYEYYATSTDGKFAGAASGALAGDWSADIKHTTLCLSCGAPTATITGGSFALATTSTLVTGAFTGGTVQVTNPGAKCTNQSFAVDGTLGSVGRWNTGTGSGHFSVTLTHYRRLVLGRCVTYGARVTGTLTLTF